MSDQTDDQGQRLESLYHEARKLSGAERGEFILREAGHDPVLMARLQALFLLPDSIAADQLETERTRSQAGPLSGGQDAQTGDQTRTFSGSSDDDRFDLKMNMEFGRCRIVMQRGAGGMGAVYLATDLENNERPVALKVMKPTRLSDLDRQRFHNETAALSRLEHPNIARLYFKGIQQWHGSDRPYFVMEYVDGTTLDEYCQKHPLTTRQLLELLRKICLAVHHGHLKGVFHRDLKPSNILVTADGEPKIIDFGVSFMRSGDAATARQSEKHEQVGTLKYMAPETAGVVEHVLDARTDVYSLGVIAFEMFASRRPGVLLHPGKLLSLDQCATGKEILQLVSQCERERLGNASRKFRGDLELVVAKALRLEIDQRYTDASELAEDLRRLMDWEPIQARSSSRAYIARMFVRRNRFATAASVTVFLAILIAAVGFGVGEARAVAARKEVEKKNADLHMRAAQLAEQRGKWPQALENYLAAEKGRSPDRLTFVAGELRAFDRMDRPADAKALITRVQSTMPDIAQSPQFLVVEGFFFWPSDPDKSIQEIQQALLHADQLTPADRAFAQALITDDIKVAAAKLRETVEHDPFNRDAWALLGICDLVMGDAQKCEQDEGVLQRLYPDDEVGTVLAAFGAAFQGRRSAAIAYLDADADLQPNLKSTLVKTVNFVSQLHSVDDIWSMSLSVPAEADLVSNIFTSATILTTAREFPIPLTFKRLAKNVTETNLMLWAINPDGLLDAAASWPNGNGEFAAGWIDFKNQKYPSAVKHLQAVQTVPNLVDCRRSAAVTLVFVQAMERIAHHIPPNPESVAIMKADFDHVIALGGVRPDVIDVEVNALPVAINYGLFAQARTLAMLWLARAPRDARAMYYLAVADSNLGDRETALSLYRQAAALRLPADLKSNALNQIQQLTASVATRPSTLTQ